MTNTPTTEALAARQVVLDAADDLETLIVNLNAALEYLNTDGWDDVNQVVIVNDPSWMYAFQVDSASPGPAFIAQQGAPTKVDLWMLRQAVAEAERIDALP